MDGSMPSKMQSLYTNIIYNFYPMDDPIYPTKFKHRTVKYTKIPENPISSLYSRTNNLPSQPHVRRVVSVNEDKQQTFRSLQNDYLKLNSTSPKRKIAIIEEDKESILSRPDVKKLPPASMARMNRAITTEKYMEEKRLIHNKTPSYSKNSTRNISREKNNDPRLSRTSCKNKPTNSGLLETSKIIKKKDYTNQQNVNNNIINIKRKKEDLSQQDIILFKNELTENGPISQHRSTVQHKYLGNRVKRDTFTKNNTVRFIHVPLEGKEKNKIKSIESETSNFVPITQDCATEIDIYFNQKHVNLTTNLNPETASKVTETDDNVKNSSQIDATVQTCTLESEKVFEDLCIPNVKLTTDKTLDNTTNNESMKLLSSSSLPNLKIPTLKISSTKNENMNSQQSYVIHRATVTYTTQQKFDLEVVGHKTGNLENPGGGYPLNMMSILKNDLKEKNFDVCAVTKQIQKKPFHNLNDTLHTNSFNCSNDNSNEEKLKKPSEIIGPVMQGDKLYSDTFINNQFMKELSFVDSFFDSLQYLEKCLYSKTSFNVHEFCNQWLSHEEIQIDSNKYQALISEENNNILRTDEDNETKESSNLCLLNSLIVDEQRRAKNLLFVLKMREDALKDFTKSQILWLENRKKFESTDISALKKKQRGALLKLQHECGEMNRMRKALLALSQKRKTALIKTKRNLEVLYISEDVSIDKSTIGGKKKLKKVVHRNPIVTPIKCFELSTNSQGQSFTLNETHDSNDKKSVIENVEKCIQTSILVNETYDSVAENFVVVEGTYLNILLHNLSLPKLFSHEKRYEVNEEALNDILTSSNTLKLNFMYSNNIERLLDQLKNVDNCSTPSTARSLVEEFDQYYKGLSDIENSKESLSFDNEKNVFTTNVVENSNNYVSFHVPTIEAMEPYSTIDKLQTVNKEQSSLDVKAIDDVDKLSTEKCICENTKIVEVENVCLETSGKISATESPMLFELSSNNLRQPVDESSSPIRPDASSIKLDGHHGAIKHKEVSPAVSEAEELHRQQLAIEQEIKALEQQPNQLIVVREIPDKPPPPYTPPMEPRQNKSVRRFTPDNDLESKVQRHLQENNMNMYMDNEDCFDEFIRDFCSESIARQQQSDKPWDATNPHVKQSSLTEDSIEKKTATELREVLSGDNAVACGNRRSDHIDDILFSEWCRCEQDWINLHVDEAIVKNQLFESIFQKVLSETIDEFKNTVLEK